MSAAVSTVVALAVSLAAFLLVTKEANDGFRTSAVSACDGTNLLRGVARLAFHHWRPTRPSLPPDYLLRIRDCEATYDQQRVVLVDESVELRFLTELSRGRRVAVRNHGETLVFISVR